METQAGVEEVYARLLADPGVVFLLGGIDTGKTTFGVELGRRAREMGIATAIVDADIGQSVVGPPTTIGLRFLGSLETVDIASLRRADGLAFVGSIAPQGHMLSLVAGTARMTTVAREAGCRLIIVDTTGLVAGLGGQGLKYQKLSLVRPDTVVAFERGGELEPVVGIARRFTAAKVIELEVQAEVVSRTVEDRMNFRESQFAAYFADGASHWRIKPTVFMPTLPPEFDLALLDGLVVGAEDGRGSCLGIGVLEYDAGDDFLRMVSPVSEGVRGLRLGSIRIDTSGRSKGPVHLKELFRTE
jgi:polynucleotide 5'-kinase involved in rRNA processing